MGGFLGSGHVDQLGLPFVVWTVVFFVPPYECTFVTI